jgi:hypothetical protein
VTSGEPFIPPPRPSSASVSFSGIQLSLLFQSPEQTRPFLFLSFKKEKKKKDKNQVITSRRSTRHLHSKIGCGGWEGPFASVSFSPVVIPQTQGVRIHAKVLRLGSWNFSPGREKKRGPFQSSTLGTLFFFRRPSTRGWYTTGPQHPFQSEIAN